MSAGHVRAVAAPHPERRGDPDAAVRRTLGLKPVDTEGPAGRSPCCKVPGGVGVTETGGWGWAPGVGLGRWGASVFNGAESRVGGERVLEAGGGDGCTTMYAR